ncbi:histone acetyltransferase Gcn5, partial [Reticulomyxa filosa]
LLFIIIYCYCCYYRKTSDYYEHLFGGVVFRLFVEQSFCEVVFLAIQPCHQSKGFGARLMNHLKEILKEYKINHILTFADNSAVGYFNKQGFNKNVTLPKVVWHKYIKTYNSAILMECQIMDEINYCFLKEQLLRQRIHLFHHLKPHTQSHILRTTDNITFPILNYIGSLFFHI